MKLLRLHSSKAVSRFAWRHKTASSLRPKTPRTRLPRCFAQDLKVDVFDLKQQLDVAIAAEDYDRAAELRDVISDRLLDDRLAVEYANRLFYVAFEKSDLEAMKRIWSKGDHVQCIHPWSGCIGGYDLVMQSWDAIFETVRRRSFRIVVEDVRVTVSDRMAFVTCQENVKSNGDRGRNRATNVFEFLDGQWAMVHHHGSPQTM